MAFVLCDLFLMKGWFPVLYRFGIDTPDTVEENTQYRIVKESLVSPITIQLAYN